MTKSQSNPTGFNVSHYEEVEHIYKKQAMYIDSDKKEARKEWVFDFEKESLVKKSILFPRAAERLFLEILSNASDAANTSRREANRDPGTIKVEMDRERIRVTNGGCAIPIQKNESIGGLYNPSIIFGMLHTSTNYEGERYGAGTNGIGAKIVNIFSKEFIVEVDDPFNHLSFRQVWTNNMSVVQEPEVVPYLGTEARVTIEYLMDFERFGYSEYPTEVFNLFCAHCIGTSFSAKIPVRFNDLEFEIPNVTAMGSLLNLEGTSSLSHQEIKGSVQMGTKKEVDKKKVPIIEYSLPGVTVYDIAIFDSPYNGGSISYVNGLITSEGGTHLNAVYSALSNFLVNKLEKKAIKLKVRDLKNHIFVIISAWVPDPEHSSQSKSELRFPTPVINFQDKELEVLKEWEMFKALENWLDDKSLALLKKSDGKKVRKVLGKFRDANWAGGPKSQECALFICEGNSANILVEKMLALGNNTTNISGTLPIRGKLLNVRNLTPEERVQKMLANKEITSIKSLLGLQEETDYSDEANLKKLRYGALIIATDADDDGIHITGLILNYLHFSFPSLFYSRFIFNLRTPVIKVFKGKNSVPFYTQQEFENWQEESGPEAVSWKVHYYKGLGSNNDKDTEEIYANPKYVCFLENEDLDRKMVLGFDKEYSEARKEWMKGALGIKPNNVAFLPISDYEQSTKEFEKIVQSIHKKHFSSYGMEVSSFIDQELVQFSLMSTRRAIPHLMDGKKECQRKIMWFMLSNKIKSEIKVTVLANKTSGDLGYKHGPSSLENAIKKMGRNYSGSNNAPLLFPEGQFGERIDDGKGADPRYLQTYMQPWVKYLYRKEDMSILKSDYLKQTDEGKVIEPFHLLPIAPDILFNGCNGIATGFASFIPNHRPSEIVCWLLNRIEGSPTDTPRPWYKGFTGTLEFKERILNDTLDDDGNPISVECLNAFVSTGRFRVSNDCVHIQELPIGMKTKVYIDWIESLYKSKMIKSFDKFNNKNLPTFKLQGLKFAATPENLKLKKAKGMNLALLDMNGFPKYYHDVNEVLEDFYQERLKFYTLRKNLRISELEQKVIMQEEKTKVIEAVASKRLEFCGGKKEKVKADAIKMGLNPIYLEKLVLWNATEEDVEDFRKNTEIMKQELEVLRKTLEKDIWKQELEELLKHLPAE